MLKRIGVLVVIFIFTSLAWIVLGRVTGGRTERQDEKLKKQVGELWGRPQVQSAPRIYLLDRSAGEKREVALAGSDIDVKLSLDYRRKGLLWYSTYRVRFAGSYKIKNTSESIREFAFSYKFPAENGIYDNFEIAVDGERIEEFEQSGGGVEIVLQVEPGLERTVGVSYGSQGMEQWWYVFGDGITRVRDFHLDIVTDFERIDFRDRSISPTRKERLDGGWKLTWEYGNLISGIQIGLELPEKLNPGPFVERVSYFAPVSLFLFLFLMFIITTVRNIRIHPMNYFFICASFFSFHLLLAYMADHMELGAAFVISAMVSILLVVSYMRLVAGVRFAFLEVGLSQTVYLVIFSYTFFLEGYTGLAVTICSVATLFVVMQLTGRIEWQKQFASS